MSTDQDNDKQNQGALNAPDSDSVDIGPVPSFLVQEDRANEYPAAAEIASGDRAEKEAEADTSTMFSAADKAEGTANTESANRPAASNNTADPTAAAKAPTETATAPAIRRFGPIFAASSLSIVWIGLVGLAAAKGELAFAEGFYAALRDGALLTAPLAVFWLIALAFQRSDPLLERRLATAQTLHKAIAPVEQAESRLASINKKLTQDLAAIESMSTVADDRLSHLEARFSTQVDRLFQASKEAEDSATKIRSAMGEERDAFDDLSDKLLARLDKLESTVASITQSLDQAGGRVSDTTSAVEDRLGKGIKAMDSASDTLTSKMDSTIGALDKSTNAFVDGAADVELRINDVTDTLLRGMSGFKSDVEGLESRSHELSEHMTTQGRVLADLATLAATESDKIQTALKTHVDEVRRSATSALEETETVSAQVAERATALSQHITETLSRAESSVDATASIFKGRIETALQSADSMLEGLETRSAEASDKVTKDLRDAEAQMSKSAEQAVDRLKEAQTLFRDEGAALVEEASATAVRSLSQLRQMRANVEAELAALEAASLSVSDHMTANTETLTKTAEDAAKRVQHASDTAADAVTARLQALEAASQSELEKMVSASDKAADTVTERLGAMEAVGTSELAKMVAAGEQASDDLVVQLAALRAAADEEVVALSLAAREASADLSAQSDALAAQADLVTKAAAGAETQIKGTGTRFMNAADELRKRLEITREELLAVETSMDEKQQSLLNTADAASSHLKEASTIFLAQAGALADESKSKVKDLDGATKRLLGSLDDGVIRVEERVMNFNTMSKQLGDQLDTTSAQITQATHSSRAELAKTRDAIGDAARQLADERDGLASSSEIIVTRLKDASTTVGEEVSRFAEKSDNAAESLKEAAQMVMAEAAEADRIMQRAVNDTKAELSTGLEDIAQGAENRVTTLREELQSTLERLLDDYEEGATRAQKESAHLIVRLGTEADRISALADTFEERAKGFEKSIQDTANDSFSKDSKALLENLAEASVDINRALSTDISDKDWQAYLDGDRNRFARRTLNLADRKIKKTIGDKFKRDRDFRETSVRFMRAFESMMERAMSGEKGNSLSVTLISSDMGKLYVLLAQSLKRLG